MESESTIETVAERQPEIPALAARHLDSFKFGHLFSWWWREWFLMIPTLLSLRRRFHATPRPAGGRRVAVFSDNLDELNGISIHSRLLVRFLREQGHSVRLVGIASHDRQFASLDNEDGVTLIRPRLSMTQAGYEGSEVAVPHMPDFLRWLSGYRPDLIEIETPSSGGMMILSAARLLGIPVVSHYRTDMFAYADLLLHDQPFVRMFTKLWVRFFTRWSRPVIVPSTFVHEKLQREMGLEPKDLARLPRGIPLEDFGPSRADGSWQEYFPENDGTTCRFIYLGRVSREKELSFFADIWPEISRRNPDIELLLVGDGPFLAEMQRSLDSLPNVAFAGALDHASVATLLAEAHWLLFPSGTDTFGNSVVEALASGTPALVSDVGGPCETVEDGKSGRILPFRDHRAWTAAVDDAVTLWRNGELESWSAAALARARSFSLERSAAAFSDFYDQVLGDADSSGNGEAPKGDARAS